MTPPPDLADKDALIAMDTENRVRKDISPYESELCALAAQRFLRLAEGYRLIIEDLGVAAACN